MVKKGRDIPGISRGGIRRSRLLILAYHAIADMREDPVLAEYSVPAPLFAAHLDALRRDRWEFVDLDTLLAALDGRAHLPRRAVLLTFDDAYADLREVVDSLMAPRGLPAVVFAVAGHIGGTNAWEREATTLDLLDVSELREVAGRGVEVGSHTTSHPSLPSVPVEELDIELKGAADRIEALGLPRPRAFAYPGGEWTPALARAVRDAGYEVAFTVDWGAVRDGGADRYTLPRVEIHSGDTVRKLRLKLALASCPGPIREGLLWLSRVASTRWRNRDRRITGARQ